MEEVKVIYVAGKITGFPGYKEKFEAAEKKLTAEGYIVLNPSLLPEGMTFGSYMHICFAMIDMAQYCYFLNNWTDSAGARKELEYALEEGKYLLYEELDSEDQ